MIHPNGYRNYNNYFYHYNRRLGATSSLVFLSQLLLLLAGFSADASEAGSCRLASTNESYGLGLSCKLFYSGQSLRLDQCRPIEDGSILRECNESIDTSKSICQLQIELTKLIPVRIQSLLNNSVCKSGDNERDELEFTVVLSSIKESGSNLILFPGARIVSIDCLKINNPTAKLFDGRFINDNFHLAKRIEVSQFQFTNITPGTFILLRNSDKLEAIVIRDCSIQNVDAYSFFFSRNFRTLKFMNLKVTGQFKSEAIILEDSNCKIPEGAKIEIQLEGSSLSRSNLHKDFIKVDRLSKCQTSIWVKISLLRNSFNRAISQEVFGNLIGTLRDRPGVELEFKFDPIDCCLDTNRWLLNTVSNSKRLGTSTSNSNRSINVPSGNQSPDHWLNPKRNSGSNHARASQSYFDIDCIDLGMKVDNFSNPNATKVEDICTERNDYPILMIGVVAILLLAALLAVFSFICFFYVLPMRGNVIMYNNRRPGAANLSLDRPASSDIVKPSSSVAEIRSSRTTGTGSPLLEFLDSKEISKSRRSGPVNQSVGRALKSPEELLKSPGPPKSVRSPAEPPPARPPKLQLPPVRPSPPPSFGPKFQLPQKPYSKLVATKTRKSHEHKQVAQKKLKSPTGNLLRLSNLKRLLSGASAKQNTKEPAESNQPAGKIDHKHRSPSPKANKSLANSAKKSSSASSKPGGGKHSSPVVVSKTATIATEKVSPTEKSPARQTSKVGSQKQQPANLGGVNKIVATKKPDQDNQNDDRLSLAFKTSG